MLLLWGFGGFQSFSGLLLSPLLDAAQLTCPESFKRLRPIVNDLQLLRLNAIEPLPATASHADEADGLQHLEMLGDLWLRQLQKQHDIVHRLLALQEQSKNLPSPGFSDSLEDISSSEGWCHELNIFRYWNMSSMDYTFF